jgi:predicted metal-dependent peptidase
MKSIDKLRKARAGLILDRPFFGSVALRLNPIEDQSCNSMWTDGKSLGYNPEFVNSLSLEHLKGIVAHEVMHIASFHHIRRGNRDHMSWNEAGDYAINGILKNSKFSLPEGVLIDKKFDNMSTDEIYSKIYRKKQQNDQDGKNGGTGGIGGPGKKSKKGQKGGKAGQGKGQGQKSDSEPAQGQGKGNKKDQNQNIGEVRDYPGKDGGKATEAELRQAEGDTKVMLTQALQADKKAGSLSAELERMIKDVVEPQLNWREILRRFIEQSAKNDYSWFPPNRRYIHQGLYLPSCKSDELGELVLSIDTSGSISQRELDSFAAEITGILEEFQNIELTVIYCDSKVKKVQEISELPVKLTPAGGGGTDFRPPFLWIQDNDKQPVCMIYLTDGYCSQYPDEPDYPVLWVGTGKFEPKFGEFVRLEV